jgi:O-antigen/teichoic acid export membrane protein
MNERRRSAFLGMLFGYAGIVISLARNVLFVPIYLHRIPLAEYGAWLATGGALALILINDYGLSGVVTQRMSACYGAEEFATLGGLTGSALAIGSLLSVGLSAISLIFVPFLPGLDTLSASESHTVVVCFIYAIVANGLSVVGATAGSVLRSLQRVVLVGSINLIAEAVNLSVILIGLLAGYGLYAIAAGVLARAAIIAIAGLAGVWFVCMRRLRTRIEVRPAVVRDFVGESSRFFLSSIAIKLQAQANVFFAGTILGPTSAAIYSLTARAYETVLMVIILINGSLVPSVTHLLGSGNIERFRAVILRLVVFLAALTALAMTMTIILNPAFLLLWVGRDAFGGQYVSILMAAALFVSSIGGVAYDALLAQGKFRLVTRFFVCTSLLQVLMLMSLLHLGLWVAPFVTIFTGCVWGVAFWANVSSDIHLTGGELRGLLGELMRVIAVSTAGAAAFGILYPSANSWPALIVEAVICGACLTGAYLWISPNLRRITYEEIGTTLRVFRVSQVP